MAEYIERMKLLDALRAKGKSWLVYDEVNSIPAADVVARDCYDRLLAENDDMRAIVDSYGGLENIQSAFEKLHEIETADVVPVRHGRWAITADEWLQHCSICGQRRPIVAGDYKWNYCPNCGARMDGDGDV